MMSEDVIVYKISEKKEEFARRVITEQVKRMEDALVELNEYAKKCDIQSLLIKLHEFYMSYKTFSCVENRYLKAFSEEELAMTRDYVNSMLQDVFALKDIVKKCKITT